MLGSIELIRLGGFHCRNLIVERRYLVFQRGSRCEIVAVKGREVLRLQIRLFRDERVQLVAAGGQLQLPQLLREELDVAVHRAGSAFGEVVLRDLVVIRLRLLEPIVEVGRPLRIRHAENDGGNVGFQLIAGGVDLARVRVGQRLQQRAGGVRSGGRDIVGGDARSQRFQIGLRGTRHNGVVEQRKLRSTVRHHARGDVGKVQKGVHIRVARGVVVRLRVLDQALGILILEIGHHRGAGVHHLALIFDKRRLHVRETVVGGGLELGVRAAARRFLRVLDARQLLGERVHDALKRGEHIRTARRVHGVHHALDGLQTVGGGIVFAEHVVVPLQRVELLVTQGGFIVFHLGVEHRLNLFDLFAACGAVALQLADDLILIFEGKELVERFDVVRIVDVVDVHRLVRAEIVGDAVRTGVVGEEQRLDLGIKHGTAARGDVLERGGGSDVEPGAAGKLRFVVHGVLAGFIRGIHGNLVDLLRQGGKVNEVGADGERGILNLGGRDVHGLLLVPHALHPEGEGADRGGQQHHQREDAVAPGVLSLHLSSSFPAFPAHAGRTISIVCRSGTNVAVPRELRLLSYSSRLTLSRLPTSSVR